MKLHLKQIKDISDQDIKFLLDNNTCETMFLEYKKELPGNSDKDKKELLKDVSAFANKQGGIIIYGIEEYQDTPSNNKIRLSQQDDFNEDEVKLHIENILNSSLEPKVNVFFKKLPYEKTYLFIIKIPQSLGRPHIIWKEKNGKFWIRTNSGVDQMNVFQLKEEFLKMDNLITNARKFRDEKLNDKFDMHGKEYNLFINKHSYVFLHFYPLGFVGNSNIEIEKYAHDFEKSFRPTYCDNGFYNLDGYKIVDSFQKEPIKAQFTLFRNGAIEVITSRNLISNEKPSFFNAHCAEASHIHYAKKAIKLYDKIEVHPPLVIFSTLSGVRGLKISEKVNRVSNESARPFDRYTLIFPEVVINHFDEELSEVFKPLFNVMWQSAGWEKSNMYDDNGKWLGEGHLNDF